MSWEDVETGRGGDVESLPVKQDAVTRSVLPGWRSVLAPHDLSGEQKVLRDYLVERLLERFGGIKAGECAMTGGVGS